MFYSSDNSTTIIILMSYYMHVNKAAVILTNKTAIKKYHQKTKMEK